MFCVSVVDWMLPCGRVSSVSLWAEFIRLHDNSARHQREDPVMTFRLNITKKN